MFIFFKTTLNAAKLLLLLYLSNVIRIENSLSALTRSFSVDMLLGGLHKETKFFANEALSYNKNNIDAGFNILKRSDFSIKPSFKYTRYKYPPLSTGNEKNYKLSVDCKKYIGSTDKAIEAGYWYKWKNYENKSNSARWNLNLSFMMKF